jgi:hypothetical protein
MAVIVFASFLDYWQTRKLVFKKSEVREESIMGTHSTARFSLGQFREVSERARAAIQQAGGLCYQPFVDYTFDPRGEAWGLYQVYLPHWDLGTEKRGEGTYKLPTGVFIWCYTYWDTVEDCLIQSIR